MQQWEAGRKEGGREAVHRSLALGHKLLVIVLQFLLHQDFGLWLEVLGNLATPYYIKRTDCLENQEAVFLCTRS